MAHYRGLLHCYHRRLAGEALSILAGMLGGLVPRQQLDRLRRCGRRQRIFTPLSTFWNFLAQVLSPTQSCRAAVRRALAARGRGRKSAISPTTGAYCQARRRLPEGVLQATWQAIAGKLSNACSPKMLWRGLRVAVVDGTTLSMPDTAANQTVWPQPRGQKPGCGFPVMKVVCFFLC